jgi:alkanesulfonate monooxygenase SsuD/methylene tetrahydromethanopterin reductase-like flavin-dependent oxidoreductase (luciferase family)
MDGSMTGRLSLYSRNKLKLGLFGANCSSGRAVTTVPERWSGSWPDCLRLARMADAAGIEFLLPVGRWKGYGGDTDYQGETLETVTWAAGLLAATERLTVFGTVHAPLIHPLIAAKQFVTADQIGQGRFGLNIVCGWNEGEFEMFGATMRDHAARYEYAQEWIDTIRLAWSDAEDFDVDGVFIKLKQVRAKPKPFGGGRPIVMNAAASPVGQSFAIRNCDALFSMTPKGKLDEFAAHVQRVKSLGREQGRDIDVFTVGVVTCRPTQREADDYYQYSVIDHADWAAVDRIMAMRGVTREAFPDDFEERRLHQANGMGGVPLVGDPDAVAAGLAALGAAGARGIGISFVNYSEELPFFCAEVMPRLVKMGLREG